MTAITCLAMNQEKDTVLETRLLIFIYPVFPSIESCLIEFPSIESSLIEIPSIEVFFN
jgi:hypothetical protein